MPEVIIFIIIYLPTSMTSAELWQNAWTHRCSQGSGKGCQGLGKGCQGSGKGCQGCDVCHRVRCQLSSPLLVPLLSETVCPPRACVPSARRCPNA